MKVLLRLKILVRVLFLSTAGCCGWWQVVDGRWLAVGDAEQTARCNKTFDAMLMFPFNKLSNPSRMLL